MLVGEFVRKESLRAIAPTSRASVPKAGDAFDSIRLQLRTQLDSLEAATGWMLRTGQSDPNAVLAGSSPYLRMWGLCVGGWLMARSALAAEAIDNAELADTQLVLARFYAEQLLPQAAGLFGAATGGARDLFALNADQLAGSSRVPSRSLG